MNKILIYMACCFVGFTFCDHKSDEDGETTMVLDSLVVVATAYNSVVSQTKLGDPSIAAWGDTIKPGMKVIAISRDLLTKGLHYNMPVKIKGLQGQYLVKDKMNKRWIDKIDIYMGLDIAKARTWGKRKVTIYFNRIPSE